MGNRSSTWAHDLGIAGGKSDNYLWRRQDLTGRRKTVVLRVHLHCADCSRRVQRKLHDVPGVHHVATDLDNNLVSVTGAVDAAAVVLFLYKKLGKRAHIVSDTEAGYGGMFLDGGGGGGGGGGFYYRAPTLPGYYGGGGGGGGGVGGYGYYPPYSTSYTQYTPYGGNPYYYGQEEPQGCTIM